MAKEKPKDLFMQFGSISGNLDAVDSSVLVDVTVDTGLSIRGEFIWLLHKIEFELDASKANIVHRIALSSIAGLVAMPNVADRGTIARCIVSTRLEVSGLGVIVSPFVFDFMPPIPLAAPQLTAYAAGSADDAGSQGKSFNVRWGYTTLPISRDVYLEIAEVWERIL